MAKPNKETTLSAKISSFINSAPDYGEEEDDLTKVEHMQQEETFSDSGDELNLAKFRKINIELLDTTDEKYKGVRSSRQEIEGEKAFDSDSGEDTDHDTGSLSEISDEGKQSDFDVSDADFGNYSSPLSDKDADAPGTSVDLFKSKSDSDVEKGHAIRNQYVLWDALLEKRIKFQKCLAISNKLPKAATFSAFNEAGGDDFKNVQMQCQMSLKKILNSLLELESVCNEINTNRFEGSLKRGMDDANITSDSDESDGSSPDIGYPKMKKRKKLLEFADEISERHKAFITFRNNTIQKWNEKTRLTQLGSKDFSAFEQSTLKQIESVLADKQRLLKRTRTMRSVYHILGEDDEPASKVSKLHECAEIFDDDDFYHQLLRELLERKTTDVTDSIQLSRQWIQLQKARSKMKKTVDTKASKGRKIRYNVHDKLVNFMMPIDNTTWSDDAKTELFSSIFGQKTASS